MSAADILAIAVAYIEGVFLGTMLGALLLPFALIGVWVAHKLKPEAA